LPFWAKKDAASIPNAKTQSTNIQFFKKHLFFNNKPISLKVRHLQTLLPSVKNQI